MWLTYTLHIHSTCILLHDNINYINKSYGRSQHNHICTSLHTFTSFACEVRYPKFILIDEGSQKGCELMRLTFTDITNKLM